MTAVQSYEQGISNWNHFEAESHLHLQMQTKFLPHISIIVAAVMLAWYFETFDFGLFKYTSKKKGDAADELLKKKHQVIGKECIPDTTTCFLIVDSYYLENGRLTTKRDLLLEDNTEYSLTGVEVESTKPVSWENLDSRHWPVNKLVINSRYARLLVASGFIMNSLNFDENDHHDVLIAGLGGGVMSGFLSEISYLNIDTTVIEKEAFIINIAENYFDHFENEQMRVIHGDVVDHIQKHDKKYDVIIVDACENQRSDVICPVPSILKKETIQLLKKRLTLNGSLAMNVYVTKDVKNMEKNILEMFSNEFNSCFFLEYFKNKKFYEAFNRLVGDRGPVQDRYFVIKLRLLRLQINLHQLEFRVDMLNQQQNHVAQQLLNVQRPHQIQPPGQQRIVQPVQGLQQNPMQQGQQINMGQPQIANMQGQRQVVQQVPMGIQQMQQPQQAHMMNMGQQIRSQPNPQQQMMPNPHQHQQQQQQMRGNPQQQMRAMPQQGPPVQQQQPPQMSQMRMQQNQQNLPQQQQQQRVPVQNMQQNQQAMRMGQAQNQQVPRMQTNPPQIQMQQQGGHQNMNVPSSQPLQMQHQGVPQNMNRPPSQPHHQIPPGGLQGLSRPPSQQMQHGTPQGINRPPSQLNMQSGGHPNMNRPPSQPHPMQQGGHLNMSRPPSQMQQPGPSNMNTPPQQQMRMQQMQQMQQNQQNMNNEPPHQHQPMHQGQPIVNGPPQQHMRIPQQQQDSQMQQGPVAMNGPPQQPQVRVAQMFQVPPKQQNMQPPPPRQQMPLQQPQAMRGQMQNSPQSSQMRMAPPQQQQPQQQQPQAGQHPIQPIRPIPQMPQGRQMHPNQLRPQQQMQMNRNLPQVSQGGPNVSDQSSMSMQQPPMQSQAMHQQPMQQHNIQQQPMQHQQPPKQQMQQTVQAVNFEPDNGQTIRINGEHAIINGLQYKIVPVPVTQGSDPPLIQNQPIQQNNQNQQQSQSMQQGQPVQQYQQAPQQQRPNTQQRGSNNQMIPNQQQPMQNQQNTPSQQNMPNQQMMPNQQNLQNQLNQSNISNMQNQNPPNNPVAPQQPPPPAKNPKPRYRAKKNNATPAPDLATPVLQQNTPNAADLNNLKPMSNGSMQATPTGSIFGKGGRRIAPPSLTPVPTQAQGQNGMKNTSNITPPPRLIQQGKNMVQVGGLTPNKQHLATPGKNVPRNLQQMKQGSTPIKRLNGKIPMRSQPGPSTSQSKSSENKENMTEIREAIISHVKGTRKMTPEYIEYVCDELTRVLRELEKANLMTDSRYISVQKLLALVKGEKKIRIDVPQRTERPVREPPTENDIDDEPANETPEERKTRYDGYMKMITNAYPMKEFNVNFARIDDDTIRKETVFYREQDMKNREAYLRKNLHTIPEEKQVKAKIEYLGLSLLDFQTELRKKIMATTVLVPPTEFLINPWSIRRTKFEYQQELKQHPDRAALEKKRKSVNYAFLQSLTKHAREFREFHKSNMTKHTKVRKSMQTYITNEAKRVAREEMKNEKLRIQKLIQEDEEGYRAMLDDKKDRRLVYLLEQTDDYIKSLCDLLKQQQDETSSGKNFSKKPTRKEYEGLAEEEKVKSILDKARNDDDEYENKTKMNFEDYYTTAHGVREEITEQHFMMGGGNPSLKLKSYQIKGLEWMVSLFNNNLNGILADEMGLGKTIQTIAFITYLMEIKKTSGPFLVIVPLSTIPNWQNEFLKWAPNVHLIVYKGPKDNRKANEPIIKSGKFNVLLTTFEYVIREKALLGKLRWKYMIIDEGHRLKNQHCKLTEMLNTRFQCQRRLLITGTPLQNKLPELWALLNFLLPSIFSSCSTFEQWFNAPFATTGEKVELTQEETMLIIRRLHKVLRPFLLRRLKKEVESELPDKMEFVIKCEMSGLQKVLYKHMQKGLLLDGKTSTGSRSLMNSMIHLRKLCNHPFLFENVEESCRAFWEARFISSVDLYRVSGKLELLDRILPKLQATGHRVLMFFQMTSMMTVVEDYLAGGSIQYLRLDGSTKPDDRGLLLDKFNAPNSKYFLFMLSTRAGGLGLNLQTADTVIIFDSDWNPHQDMQAQDRAHRIGQKAEVRVFRLITANSVEEKILASARFKLNVDEKVIQAGKFDNRSTGAERRQILENIIKAENESEEDEDVPNDEEINDILSRSEEEFELFQRMDQKRYEHDKREKVKPRLCGDDEIPRDILRAADETDYIEKAKEEGRVPYLEIMPGSRRTRKEVDYSADTMSDDKFLEKLFDGDDVTLAKPEQRPDSKPDSMPGSKPGPSFEAPKESSSEKVAVAEASPGKQPEAPVFKVPRLIVKIGDGLKAKIKKIENDSVLQPLKKERKEKEEDHQKEQKEKDLKRKSDQPPIEKLRIKLPGEPLEKYKKVGEDSVKRDDQDKDRKDEKSHKNRSDDDSSPKKKKQRRDHDADESLEKKKKKHRDHDTDESQDNKKKKHRDHDADGSPEKRKRKHRDNDTDESPEKKKKKHKDKKDSDEPLLKTPETSSPFSMKIKIRPILSEPLKDHPAPTEMSKDRPTLLEPKKERPASSEPSKDRLTLSVPRKERSTFPETSKDRPTSSEPRKVCFNSYEPIKDRPTSSESSKDGSSSTESNKIHPPIKLKLKLMANPVPETSNMDGGSKEKSEKKEPKESKEPKKAKEPKEPKEPTKELKESKDPKEHKERKEHKEHKKKSHENETEEERRARKEAKRLKRQQEEKEDEVRHQEKLARKAARKEQKRLEQQNLENATTSVNEKAAGSA